MQLQFSEQLLFFRAKRTVLSAHWLDIPLDQHDEVFTVPGVEDLSLLSEIRTHVDAVIACGNTLRQFARAMRTLAAHYAWEDGDDEDEVRRIYETNLRQSYNAGRHEQLQRLRHVRPYWRYRCNEAMNYPQPIHRSWDGLVLRADDPWWDTHGPANGWGCNCSVEALGDRDLERLGKSGPDTAPPIEWHFVEVEGRLKRTPKGIDPGFAYTPGKRYLQLNSRTADSSPPTAPAQ